MSKALNELKKATMASYVSKLAIREGMDPDTWNGKNPKNPLVNLHATTEKKIDGREPMIGHMHLSTAAGIHGLDHEQALADIRAHGEHVGGDKKVRVTLSQHQKVWEAYNAPTNTILKKPGQKPSDLGQTAKEKVAARLLDKKFKAAKKSTSKTNEETVNEAGKNPYGPGYKLVDKDGKELSVGHKFMHTSHHEGSKPEHHEITGWQSGEQRGNSSSSGRVAVRIGKGKKAYDTEYFPHVFGMKVVKEEAVNEIKTSTLASVATKRFAQAQAALKDKDYGGYVKNKAKSMKAADATTPKSGWSPEDDKKNEEVDGGTGFVSAQEKYRQIRESKLRNRKGK